MTIDVTMATIRSVTIAVPALLILTITISTKSILNAARRPFQAILVPLLSSFLMFTALSYLPLVVEDVLNRGGVPFPDVHTRNAQKLVHKFDVADLHCDTLLWGRRDFVKTTYHPFVKTRPLGAVDIPRMRQGHIKLQVFAAVNSVPRKQNFQRNAPPSVLADPLVLKTALEGWPMKTWFSPKERILHQFRRLATVARDNKELIHITRSKSDLTDSGETLQPIRAILAVEGLGCLNSDIATVDQFFHAGIRVLGPAHFFDTEVGGSRSGESKGGITEFGRHVLRRMKHHGMIVDLAHASDQLIADVLDMTPEERPHLMVSHTGIDAICPSARNLGDELIIRIAEAGGLVGITLFEPALCGDDLIQSFVDSVSHVSKITGGVRSIAIGSDWDGKVYTAVSAADTHVLSASLIEIGNYSHGDVRRIMYDNAFDFFMKSLPH